MGKITRRELLVTGGAAGAMALAGLTSPTIARESIPGTNYNTDEIAAYDNFKKIVEHHPLFQQAQEGQLHTNLCVVFDKSSSVIPPEYERQKRGTAEALRSLFVKNAIMYAQGGNGQKGIGFSLVEFDDRFDVRLPWAILKTEEDIEEMALLIESMPKDWRQRDTNLVNGINGAVRHLSTSRLKALRSVIDISGDGIENSQSRSPEIGASTVKAASDACARRGFRCNGLAINSSDSHTGGVAEDITDYYDRYVRTPNGFVIGIRDWYDFEDAMSRKLQLEIAGLSPDRQDYERFSIAA